MVVGSMQRITVDGAELAFWDIGAGDPVLFIHGGSGDECLAIIQQPELTQKFRIIHFQRPGYALSEGNPGQVTVESMVSQYKKVLDHLGIERVNVEGLSLGGSLALQFAMDYPGSVNALALLEPAIPSVFGKYPDFEKVMGEVGEHYGSGDREAAIHVMAAELAGPEYQDDLSRHLPAGWQERWKDELDVLMTQEIVAMNQWSFGPEDAARITCPVLNLTGERTRPYFKEIHETIKQWMPHAENVVLPDTTHFMLEMNPKGCAEALCSFFAQHPIR
jgi:pimeloyl-ACP methyl ester carboxylesterase